MSRRPPLNRICSFYFYLVGWMSGGKRAPTSLRIRSLVYGYRSSIVPVPNPLWVDFRSTNARARKSFCVGVSFPRNLYRFARVLHIQLLSRATVTRKLHVDVRMLLTICSLYFYLVGWMSMGNGPSIAEDTFSRLRVSFEYRSSTQSSLGGLPQYKINFCSTESTLVVQNHPRST